MRFGVYLFAIVAFATSVSAQADGLPVYRTPMPAGGMDVIQPGYSLHTPGKGWIMTGSVKPENGVIRGWERFERWNFERRRSDGSNYYLQFETVRWPRNTTEPEAYLRLRYRPELNSAKITVSSKIVNGASCVVLATQDKFHQLCTHPEQPGFAVELRYERDAADPSVEAEAAAVAASLKFTPLPYRVREIRLGCTVGHMAQADGALWVPCAASDLNARGKLVRIDPATGMIAAMIEVGRVPNDAVAAAGSVWVGNLFDDNVMRIDPKTNAVTATIGLSGGPVELLAAAGDVWAKPSTSGKDGNDTTLVRINPITNAIDKAIRLEGVYLGESVDRWLLQRPVRDGDWLRLDGKSGAVTARIKLGRMTQLLHHDARWLWLVDYSGDETVILKLDLDAPELPPVEVRRTAGDVYDIAWWNGEVCVLRQLSVQCTSDGGTTTHEVAIVATVPAKLHVIGGSLWVEDWSNSSILRIDPK